jgi:subtilisin family serine protease
MHRRIHADVLLMRFCATPFYALQRPLRSCLAVACVVLIVSISPIAAWSQSRVTVLRGKELVISYEPSRDSASTGEFVIQHLHLPSGLTVRDVYPSKNIAIVSPLESNDLTPAPVEVDQSDVAQACETILHENRGVPLQCGPNVVRYLSRTTNDPDLSSLYGLTKMSAFSAWDITVGHSSVVVAIVDTGVFYNHSDLVENMAVNTGEIPANGIDDDSNGYVDDYLGYDFFSGDGDPVDENGHGTHCAGIVAARGDNGIGGAGIAWGVSVLPVRALGPGGGGSDSDVAAGILYAAQRGASVISLSLGGETPSTVIDSAIDYARSLGALVVVAAGNEGVNNDIVPSYPANSEIDNVVSVAATDADDHFAAFSNYGTSTVDLAAPGSRIFSTYLANSYVLMSGTSMATPYVAGVAAMMKSANPALTYADLKSGLFQSVDELATLQGKLVTGGRINAHKAAYLASTGLPLAPTPVAQPGQGNTARKLSLTWRRYGQRAVLSGYLKDSRRVAVARKYVYLDCASINARRSRSDNDGYFSFRITRPRRAQKCYAFDSFGNRSRSVTVR